MERIARYLLLFIIIILASCAQERPEDRLRFGIPRLPDILHPLYATDALGERIGRLLYRPLVNFDQEQRPVPDLARWEQIDDRTYRFTLIEPLTRFHDGTVLTTQDVAATYRHVLDETNGSPHRGTLDLLERVKVVDELRVDFSISRPNRHFPSYLALGIVPARSLQGDLPAAERRGKTPPGTGAFRLDGGDGVTTLRLKRLIDGHHIEFVAVRDPVVRVLKLVRGEIDLLQNDLPPELFAYLEDREKIRVQRVRGTNFTYLGFNLEDAATSNPKIRRAIAHALDRDAIMNHVFRGAAISAQALFPPAHWLGANLEPVEYDPALARRLLKEAGYDASHPLKLVYKTSSDPFRLRLAAILQNQLSAVGLEVDLQSFDWGTFYGDIKSGNFQMYSLTWVGLKTPDSFRYLFHSDSVPPTGANRGRYRSIRADDLMNRAERTAAQSEEQALYAELQQLLLDELPYVPLWYEDHKVALRNGVSGYELASDGNYDGLNQVSWTN